ncbi:NepR family anti-sigma factor [Altererythrobacter sp. GH1-8]|uniref:NepR family anti-sigma factor n=1 Tax=Altererythrobacter sp. GH1-8 TaxID=3349333 RepID=UPI00374CD4B2
MKDFMGSEKTPQANHSPKPHGKDDSSSCRSNSGQPRKPDWADGLRKLYDSVVDEPLPDNFKDLLAKLDDEPESGRH